jgi:hypothetical protein
VVDDFAGVEEAGRHGSRMRVGREGV